MLMCIYLIISKVEYFYILVQLGIFFSEVQNYTLGPFSFRVVCHVDLLSFLTYSVNMSILQLQKSSCCFCFLPFPFLQCLLKHLHQLVFVSQYSLYLNVTSQVFETNHKGLNVGYKKLIKGQQQENSYFFLFECWEIKFKAKMQLS